MPALGRGCNTESDPLCCSPWAAAGAGGLGFSPEVTLSTYPPFTALSLTGFVFFFLAPWQLFFGFVLFCVVFHLIDYLG